MNETNKFFLKAFVPFILFFIFLAVVPTEIIDKLPFPALIVFLVFANIFFQAHKLDKSAEKDPLLEKELKRDFFMLNSKSAWIVIILAIVLLPLIGGLSKKYGISPYFRHGLWIIFGIAFYLVVKNIKKKNKL